MAILTSGQGIVPRPYGYAMRKVVLPVKASTFIAMGALVALINGACVPATTANAGNVIGVAEHDQTGGAADGTTRITVLTDCIFIFPAGVAAPTDFTPYGSLVFAEDDHTIGTGGLGATQVIAGRFVGIEDDGSVRVYIAEVGADDAPGAVANQVSGTNIANTNASTVQRVGRVSRYLCPTLSQNCTVTLGTTGAVKGDVMRIIRTDVNAFTLAVNNGGAGAGTLATLVASKVGFVQAWFDGTNWLFDGCSAT